MSGPISHGNIHAYPGHPCIKTLLEFTGALEPDGDLDKAETLGAEILVEAMLRATPGEGGLQ